MNQGTNSDATGKLVLRLAIGGLMLFHGVAKMVNPDFMTGIVKLVTAAGLPTEVAYGVYIGEVIAPVMILRHSPAAGRWPRRQHRTPPPRACRPGSTHSSRR